MTTSKLAKGTHLRWVPIADMRVNPLAQRELKQAHVDAMAADFDLDRIGYPVVNLRDGFWFVVDGNHRVNALKAVGWGDQQIQCEAYEGLTAEEEAEEFLRRNTVLSVTAFDKFMVGVAAGREEPSDIDRIVRSAGLVVTREMVPGGVRAVSTLQRVYRRGPHVLARTLRLIRDTYGDAGLEASVIDGIGLLCQRYAANLDDEVFIRKLGKAHGGVAGLTNKAEVLRRQTGSQRSHCIAAAAVEIINSGRGGTKLAGWWKA